VSLLVAVSLTKPERSHFFSWFYGKSKEDFEKFCGAKSTAGGSTSPKAMPNRSPKAQSKSGGKPHPYPTRPEAAFHL
jgi:hypothetical protein